MKVSEIFELMIEAGIENDPRGKDEVEVQLKKRREQFEELSSNKKKDFDQEKLTNPYLDSGIHFMDRDLEVKRVLVGIDIDSAEVLLAKELERQGKKIDLIIGHHPIGKALSDLHEVMDINTDILVAAGVPENIAEGVLAERIREVSRTVAPGNHFQAVDVARLLNVPLMNVHTPADNAVWKFVSEAIAEEKPKTLGQIIELLKKVPEYKIAVGRGAGPTIFAGAENSRVGKIVVGMTGGTSGSEKAYERLSHHGIGTMVDMHISEKSRDEASKHFVNVVVAGHISSDSLGMNLLLDKLEEKGIEIVSCSGLIRHSRV